MQHGLSVSKWASDAPATDAWRETATVEHEQVNSQLETGKNSNTNNQKLFSQSYAQAFLIGLSIGVLLSGTALAVSLTLWLSHSADTTTSTSATNSTQSNTVTTSVLRSNTTTVTTSTSTSTTSSSTTTSTSTTSSSTTTSTSTTSSSTTTTARPYWNTILYDFDQEVNDVYSNSSGTYNGVATSSTTYISPGITGYGYAMNFNSANPQSFVTIQNWIDLYNASFTIEFWLYLTSASSANDQGVFGQCQSQTQSYCLHILVQNANIRFAFYTNDGIGATNLSVGIWYHIACVFARSSMQQLIYVNGILDYSGSVSSAFFATNTISTIGVTYEKGSGSPTYFRNGRIDQLLITIHQSKNASTVLDDATLTAYFSFDSSTSFWLDNGPQFLNGTFGGNVTSVAGKVGQAIAFSKSSTGSYFQIDSKFVLLTVKNQPHSYAFWIKPTNNSGTIIKESSGGSSMWSMIPFGYTSSGWISAQIWDGSTSQYALTNVPPLNVWTHIAMTYSFTVGTKLYMNGSLYATKALNPMYYDAPAFSTATLTIGYTNQANEVGQTIIGQFVGAIDELRIYSRALTASEIASLANV